MSKLITLFVLFFCLCAVNAFSQSPKIALRDAKALCNRVAEIKELPHHYDERGIDAAYDALAEAGEVVVPCLIDKISDITVMPDPRCPHITGETRVGDVAYFVLVGITKIGFVELFPDEMQKEYETRGVYAYHDFIERKGKRKQLQAKLREWYRKKQRAKIMAEPTI